MQETASATMKRHPIAYNRQRFKETASEFLAIAGSSIHLEVARERLFDRVSQYQVDRPGKPDDFYRGNIIRIRDCARALRSMLEERSEGLAGFSVTQALFDLAHDRRRPDLTPAFYADLLHVLMGVQGIGPGVPPNDMRLNPDLTGRRASRMRSDQLDRIWTRVEKHMSAYAHGLEEETIQRRKERRERILSVLNGSEEDWNDWKWQVRHVVRNVEGLNGLVSLTDDESSGVTMARQERLPFGITPYYLSLIDSEPSHRDRGVRAQVLPPATYVERMKAGRLADRCGLDFMLERDTSPIDLITRRYPGIVILKPYNTCPQICVYCQRNWEITDVLAEDALASPEKITQALNWIKEHPAIREVLVTGGDPLTMDDDTLQPILSGLSEIPSVERIRIGTRTLVTMPMRITEKLAGLLSSYQVPGRRQVAFVTHVEHPYEVTPEMSEAVHRLRMVGIPVYNQLVYTFYVSRRFEAALLRRLLRLVGIDPYYTFATKGKEETEAYRVPIVRLLQEASEEARLLPGLERTDEPVYNLPGLGKNHIRAVQHRDLLAIRPNGARVYEFHPWEKKLALADTYIYTDVSIYEYMRRLRAAGENTAVYKTIWYYY